MLIEEEFGVFGHAWPPVLMHMTPLPFILVVSPREEIKQIYSVPLEHGVTVAEREEIELGVFEPLGGKITLRAEVIGGNPRSEGTKSYFGLDCVIVTPVK